MSKSLIKSLTDQIKASFGQTLEALTRREKLFLCAYVARQQMNNEGESGPVSLEVQNLAASIPEKLTFEQSTDLISFLIKSKHV